MKKTALVISLFFVLLYTQSAYSKVFDLSNFKLALVQMDSSSKDVALNLAKIEQFVIEAASQNSEIIVFPELSISGYEVKQPWLLAEPIPGKSSDFISQLAVTHAIAIVVGIIEAAKHHKLYITQLVAFEDGRVEHYRKTHLGPTREALVFAKGKQLPVFKMQDTVGHQVSFAITLCYDTHFPELFSLYSMKDAQIIFAPHASHLKGQQRIDIWNKYLGARAYDNTYYIAAVNHVYQKGDKFYGGGSALWHYDAHLEDFYAGYDEHISYYTLDILALNEKRNNSSAFYTKDRENELYVEHLIEQLEREEDKKYKDVFKK